MNKSNPRKTTAYQGEKLYRLKIVGLKIKPVSQPQPNYWRENETRQILMED